MVQRWEARGFKLAATAKNGKFVKYEDYAKLKADRDYWYEKCLDAGLLDKNIEDN